MVIRKLVLFSTLLICLATSNVWGKNKMCELKRDPSGKWLMGIPDSLLNRDLLFGARVISLTSADKSISAGQMRYNPVVMQLVEANGEIVFNTINVSDIAEDGATIKEALKRNTRDAIALNLTIVKKDPTVRWIDLSSIFERPFPLVYPIASKNTTPVVRDQSGLYNAKAYGRNLEMKAVYQYNSPLAPFAADIQYSIVLLPDTPMPKRRSDPRMGYLNVKKKIYAEKKPVQSVQYITRWRIEPSAQDAQAHQRGELVEPQQPIIIHIDSGVPKDWRVYVKQGIEDWNRAFESIGFKNVIRTMEYTPDFDSEDSRNVCFRYLPLDFANANGAQWNDPRTGEILQGDILFWQNATNLLQTWRFAQTAAVDPMARPAQLDNHTMGEMIRYAVAHEMGHLLGLQHNMRSSYAYPVDSLRSPSFTQKYGTTASIMDYARFNYVAQPGDLEKGVRLSPPVLGPFDYLSIKYGYGLFYDAANEKNSLNQLFNQVENDPMYLFSSSPIAVIATDPAVQTDAIGNDLTYSAELGIRNIKLIIQHLAQWTLVPDGNTERMGKMHDAVCKHYFRLLSLSIPNIGGIHSYPRVKGKTQKPLEYIPVEKQKETVSFIVEQLLKADKVLETKDITAYLGSQSNTIISGQKEILDKLFSYNMLIRLLEQEGSKPEGYAAAAYLSDACQIISYRSKHYSVYQDALQIYSIEKLMQLCVARKDAKGRQTPFDVLAATYARTEIERLSLKLKGAKDPQSALLLSTINNCKKELCSTRSRVEEGEKIKEDNNDEN